MAKSVKEEKNLEDIMKDLDKVYGKGSVIYGNNVEKSSEVVSTGSLSLDIATGIGGIPSDGKIIEIYGWESSGKSTLVQTIIGNYQKQYPERKVLLVDGEYSLDSDYAKTLGVNMNEVLLVQLDAGAGEAAFNKADKLCESGQIGLVIYDSYNSLKCKKILDGEAGEHALGLQAKLMDVVVAKSNAHGMKHKTTSIYVGQLREKIGVMFGSPETTSGGNALRFYAHMRLKTSRSTTKDNSVMDGEEKMGNLHKVNIEKNKLSAPFKKAEYNIIYGEGIDKYSEIIEIGHEVGVFKKYGENITVEGEKRTILEFIQLLQDNDELFQKYRTEILNKTIYKIDESKNKETTS